MQPEPLPADLAARFAGFQPFAFGGTGTLYFGVHPVSGQMVLLKLLAASQTSEPSERARHRRELRKQLGIAYPHLPRVLEEGESAGRTWFLREFVSGESLARRLRQRGALRTPAALSVIGQLASTLDALHRHGLTQRDLKPGHVLFRSDVTGAEIVQLIDTGIAATVEGGPAELRGTAAYIAPELLENTPPSFRTDLYALGCLAHELLTGSQPFARGSVEETLAAQRTEAVPELDPAVPAAVRTLIGNMLAKDPRRRPFSAQQVRRSLEPFLPDTTPPAPPVPRSSPPPPPAEALGSRLSGAPGFGAQGLESGGARRDVADAAADGGDAAGTRAGGGGQRHGTPATERTAPRSATDTGRHGWSTAPGAAVASEGSNQAQQGGTPGAAVSGRPRAEDGGASAHGARAATSAVGGRSSPPGIGAPPEAAGGSGAERVGRSSPPGIGAPPPAAGSSGAVRSSRPSGTGGESARRSTPPPPPPEALGAGARGAGRRSGPPEQPCDALAAGARAGSQSSAANGGESRAPVKRPPPDATMELRAEELEPASVAVDIGAVIDKARAARGVPSGAAREQAAPATEELDLDALLGATEPARTDVKVPSRVPTQRPGSLSPPKPTAADYDPEDSAPTIAIDLSLRKPVTPSTGPGPGASSASARPPATGSQPAPPSAAAAMRSRKSTQLGMGPVRAPINTSADAISLSRTQRGLASQAPAAGEGSEDAASLSRTQRGLGSKAPSSGDASAASSRAQTGRGAPGDIDTRAAEPSPLDTQPGLGSQAPASGAASGVAASTSRAQTVRGAQDDSDSRAAEPSPLDTQRGLGSQAPASDEASASPASLLARTGRGVGDANAAAASASRTQRGLGSQAPASGDASAAAASPSRAQTGEGSHGAAPASISAGVDAASPSRTHRGLGSPGAADGSTEPRADLASHSRVHAGEETQAAHDADGASGVAGAPSHAAAGPGLLSRTHSGLGPQGPTPVRIPSSFASGAEAADFAAISQGSAAAQDAASAAAPAGVDDLHGSSVDAAGSDLSSVAAAGAAAKTAGSSAEHSSSDGARDAKAGVGRIDLFDSQADQDRPLRAPQRPPLSQRPHILLWAAAALVLLAIALRLVRGRGPERAGSGTVVVRVPEPEPVAAPAQPAPDAPAQPAAAAAPSADPQPTAAEPRAAEAPVAAAEPGPGDSSENNARVEAPSGGTNAPAVPTVTAAQAGKGFLREPGAVSASGVVPYRARPAAESDFKAKARQLYQEGKFREAADSYQRASQRNPTDAAAFAGAGASWLATGDADRAIAAYQRAVQLKPEVSGFHAALGRAYLTKGDRARAIAAYNKALELDPENQAARSGVAALKGK